MASDKVAAALAVVLWSLTGCEADTMDSLVHGLAGGEAGGAACTACSEFQWVALSGGTFPMGSAELPVATPVHEVDVPAFYLSRSEVTVCQYCTCVAAGACTRPGVGASCNWGVAGRDWHPVNCVDWEQAQDFAVFAGGRLPSEAEWEYAARSRGQDRDYPWGDEPATCERAVMNDGHGDGCGMGETTWPVCSKAAGDSDQGICDLAGNVWEWVADASHASYDGAPLDGGAWLLPPSPQRVLRGGSRRDAAGLCRAALRASNDPDTRYDNLGFRVARDSAP